MRFQFYLWLEGDVEVNIAVADDAPYVSAIFLFLPSLHERALWPMSLNCIWISLYCGLSGILNQRCLCCGQIKLFLFLFVDAGVLVLSLCSKAEVKTWPRHWGLNPFLDLNIHSKTKWPQKSGHEKDFRPTSGSKCAFSLQENDDREQCNVSGTAGLKGFKRIYFFFPFYLNFKDIGEHFTPFHYPKEDCL